MGMHADTETASIKEPFGEGEESIAMLHIESNGNNTYDCGPESADVDTPVTEDGEAVASGFSGS